MQRLPNNALGKALFTLLNEKLPGITVYDFVPEEAAVPYVTIGTMVTNDISSKAETAYKVAIQINIWSEYRGKYEINKIAERIMALLCSNEGYIDVTADGFTAYQNTIDMYEAYPEDAYGYNGVISLEVRVKDQSGK